MSNNRQRRGGHQVVAQTTQPFNGVKVFSATMVSEREKLGDRISEWLRSNPQIRTTDAIVTQSSDEAFHCVTITLFFWEELD